MILKYLILTFCSSANFFASLLGFTLKPIKTALDALAKEDKEDDKKPDDKFRSPSDVGDKPSKQTQPDPMDYSPHTTVGDPSYSTPSNVTSASSFGDEPGDDTDSSPSGDSGDMGFSTAVGGFIEKKNLPKAKKKMKRGGLASKK